MKTLQELYNEVMNSDVLKTEFLTLTTPEQVVAFAEKNGITGRDVTPFLLARIAELTEGASLNANIALVFNNVRLAASVAAGVIQPD